MTVEIPAGLCPEREAICREALRHVGVGEVPYASNRGPCERFFPGWQIARLEALDRERGRLTKGPPWCAYYVCHVWHQALGEHPLGAHLGSVHEMARRADQRGLWVPAWDAAQFAGPAPGDAFVMLDATFEHDRRVTGHTGIILRVSTDGREWITVEGNTGHAVRVGRRRVTGDRQRGIIHALPDQGFGSTWELGLGDVEGVEDVTALGTR